MYDHQTERVTPVSETLSWRSKLWKMLSDFDELNKDQGSAPRNVVEMHDSVDEQYDTWKLSLKAH